MLDIMQPVPASKLTTAHYATICNVSCRRTYYDELLGKARQKEKDAAKRRRARDKFNSLLRHARDVNVDTSWDTFKREYRDDKEFREVGSSEAKDLFYKHIDKLKAKATERKRDRSADTGASAGSGDERSRKRRSSRCGGAAASPCLVMSWVLGGSERTVEGNSPLAGSRACRGEVNNWDHLLVSCDAACAAPCTMYMHNPPLVPVNYHCRHSEGATAGGETVSQPEDASEPNPDAGGSRRASGGDPEEGEL